MKKIFINSNATTIGGMTLYKNCTDSKTGCQCTEENFWEAVNDSKIRRCTYLVRLLNDVIASNDETRIKNIFGSDWYKLFLKRCREEGKDDAWLERHHAQPPLERLKAYRDFVKHHVKCVTPMCCAFDNNERAQKNCHLNGLVMLDFDHLPFEPEEVWKRIKQKPELLARCLWAYRTISWFGCRLVLMADPTVGNLADNQIVIAQQLGLYEYLDPKCQDASHLSILPTKENIFHLDPQVFSYYGREFAEKYEADYRAGNSKPLHHKFYDKQSDKAAKAKTVEVKVSKPAPEGKAEAATEAAAADDYRVGELTVGEILSERFRTPPEEGFRHDTYLVTAADVYTLCGHNRERALRALSRLQCLQDYVAEESNESVEKFVEYGAKRVDEAEARGEYYNLTTEMNDVIKRLSGRSYYELRRAGRTTSEDADTSVGNSNKQQMMKLTEDYGGELNDIKQQFEILPLMFGTQKQNKFPALFVAGSTVLATLLTRCHYSFYGPQGATDCRLNSMAYVIGPSGSGKSSIGHLIRQMAKPLQEVGDKAIGEYNRWIDSGSELTAKPRLRNPILVPKTTQAQFLEQLGNNYEIIDGKKWHEHLFLFSEELAAILKQYKSPYYDLRDFEVASFHAETASQATKSTDSKMYAGPCLWNIVVTGTDNALMSKFSLSDVESGIAARSTFAPFPDDMEMCAFDVTPDMRREQQLTEAARKLYKVKGKLGGKQGFEKLAKQIWDYSKEVHDEAKAERDKAKASAMLQIVHRAALYGFNLSAGPIILRHWDQMVEDSDGYYYCPDTFTIDEWDWGLCKWVLDFHRETQWYYLGGKYVRANLAKESEYYKPLNLQDSTALKLAQLPAEFTAADVERSFGIREGSARSCIKRLIAKGLAEKVTDGRKTGEAMTLYRKTKTSVL